MVKFGRTSFVANNRVVFNVYERMEADLSKTEMVRRMQTSRAGLERLLDPENRSVTLHTLDKAARSLGKRLKLTLV